MRRIILGLAVLASVGFVSTAQAASVTTYRWGTFGKTGETAPAPVSVGNLTGVTSIAAANQSDMALAGGVVYTWGSGQDGVLGQGDRADHFASAVPVSLPGSVSAMGEDQNTDVAVVSGQPYGWGRDNKGQLCQGNTHLHESPVELRGLSDVVQVAGGGQHMVYLLADGSVVGCGEGSNGQLCQGQFADSETPVEADLSGLPAPVASISAGSNSTGLLLTDGEIWSCGTNAHGQLGDGTTKNRDTPVQVQLPGPAVSMDFGGNGVADGTAIAVLADGQVWTWGSDSHGQLGHGVASHIPGSHPHQVTGLPAATWTSVACGGTTCYALDSVGDVYAWGANDAGQVGDGTTGSDVLTPTLVQSGVTIISSTSDDAVAA